MRNFLLFCLLLLAGSTKLQAQPYPTIFGRDSTIWYVFADDFDGGIPYYPPTIIYTTKTDTLVQGISYRKVTAKSTTRPLWSISPFWMREDTVTGKVWSRFFTGIDTVERLLMDFTLKVGDTFYRTTTPFPVWMIADSVYFDSQNQKHIRFNQIAVITSPSTPRAAEFITGVGCNWGLLYNFCVISSCGFYEQGLVCAYKNQERIYKDTSSVFGNDCTYPLGLAAPQNKENTFQIGPNPVADWLSISLPAKVSLATIYNVAGQKVWHREEATQNLKIDCSQWPPGLYILRLQDKSGAASSQTFLKQ